MNAEMAKGEMPAHKGLAHTLYPGEKLAHTLRPGKRMWQEARSVIKTRTCKGVAVHQRAPRAVLLLCYTICFRLRAAQPVHAAYNRQRGQLRKQPRPLDLVCSVSGCVLAPAAPPCAAAASAEIAAGITLLHRGSLPQVCPITIGANAKTVQPVDGHINLTAVHDTVRQVRPVAKLPLDCH